MGPANSLYCENLDYTKEKAAVTEAFIDVTGRKLREGKLEEQLHGFNQRPRRLRSRVVEVATDKLGVLLGVPKAKEARTTQELYRKLYSLVQEQKELESEEYHDGQIDF